MGYRLPVVARQSIPAARQAERRGACLETVRQFERPRALVDALGRPMRDLRLSVTDRCNMRCTYCMPKQVYGPTYRFLQQSELLSFEELRDLAAVFVSLGVGKIRLTGGEPLVRKHLPALVHLLKPLGAELALTTNGALLENLAADLKAAGLDRVTVSLDALDPEVFRSMSGADHVAPDDVLAGIDAALRVDLKVKVNTVVRKGYNDSEVLPLVRHFRRKGVPVRFIEYMDVGVTNGWSYREVVPSSDLRSMLHELFPIEELAPGYAGEVSRRFAYADGAGEVGFISSVTQPFCGDCTRARVSARGMLYTCLFAEQGVDLREALRKQGVEEVSALVVRTWEARAARYSEERGTTTSKTASRIEMGYIGG